MRINTLIQTSTPRGKRTLGEIEYNVGEKKSTQERKR